LDPEPVVRIPELAERQRRMADQMAVLESDEAEQLRRLEQAEAELKARQAEAQRAAEATAQQLAEREAALKAEFAALQQAEEQSLARIEEIEARVRLQRAITERAEAQTIKNESLEPAEVPSPDDLFPSITSEVEELNGVDSAPQTTAIEPFIGTPKPEVVKGIAPLDEPWLEIDLGHNGNGKRAKEVSVENTSSDHYMLEPLEPVTSPSEGFGQLASVLQPGQGESGVSSMIMDRLNSGAPTQRAAALADLTDLGGEEAYHLIAKS